MSTHGRKALKSVDVYHRRLRCRVIPWSHGLHSWVGFVYVFDDPEREDLLVYFVPNMDEPVIGFRVHHTRVWLSKGEVRLESEPDPDIDELVTTFSIESAP